MHNVTNRKILRSKAYMRAGIHLDLKLHSMMYGFMKHTVAKHPKLCAVLPLLFILAFAIPTVWTSVVHVNFVANDILSNQSSPYVKMGKVFGLDQSVQTILIPKNSEKTVAVNLFFSGQKKIEHAISKFSLSVTETINGKQSMKTFHHKALCMPDTPGFDLTLGSTKQLVATQFALGNEAEHEGHVGHLQPQSSSDSHGGMHSNMTDPHAGHSTASMSLSAGKDGCRQLSIGSFGNSSQIFEKARNVNGTLVVHLGNLGMVPLAEMLAGVSLTNTQNFKAVRASYHMQPAIQTGVWAHTDIKFEQYMSALVKHLVSVDIGENLSVLVGLSRPILEIQIMAAVPWVGVTLALLIVFAFRMIGHKDSQHRLAEVTVSFISVVTAVLSAVAILMISKLPVSPLVVIGGAVIIEIGLDDTFIILDRLHFMQQTKPDLNRAGLLAESFADAATTILITTITDNILYGMLMISTNAVTSTFGLFMIIGLSVDFFLQITFFPGVLYLRLPKNENLPYRENRQMKRKVDVETESGGQSQVNTPFRDVSEITDTTHTSNITKKDEIVIKSRSRESFSPLPAFREGIDRSLMQHFFFAKYAPMFRKKWFRWMALGIGVVIVAIAVTGFAVIQFDTVSHERLVVSGSVGDRFAINRKSEFPKASQMMYVVFDDKVNYTSPIIRSKIKEMCGKLEGNIGTKGFSMRCWVADFEKWSSLNDTDDHSGHTGGHSGHTMSNHTMMNHTMSNHTMMNHTMSNHTMSNHTMMNHTMMNHTMMNHTSHSSHTMSNHTSFIKQLKEMTKSTGFEKSRIDLMFSDHKLIMTRLGVPVSPPGTIKDALALKTSVLSLLQPFGIPFGVAMGEIANAENLVTTSTETTWILVQTAGVMTLFSALFLVNPLSSILMLFTMASCIGVSLFVLWAGDFPTDSFILSVIIIALGSGMDYAAHVIHDFNIVQGFPQQRLQVTIGEVGEPILFSFLCNASILVLITESFVLNTGIALLVISSACGFLLSLLVIPAVLLLWAPPPALREENIQRVLKHKASTEITEMDVMQNHSN